MAVYVDDMNASFRGMTMCHMIADSSHELLEMAEKIGVNPKWIQKAGTWQEHFDIALSKKQMALEHGAIAVTMLELGRKLNERLKEAAQ
jgi:hypothetical protein